MAKFLNAPAGCDTVRLLQGGLVFENGSPSIYRERVLPTKLIEFNFGTYTAVPGENENARSQDCSNH